MLQVILARGVVVRIQKEPIEFASSCKLQRIARDLGIDCLLAPVKTLAHELWRIVFVEPNSRFLELRNALTAPLNSNIAHAASYCEVRQEHLLPQAFIVFHKIEDEATISVPMKFLEQSSGEVLGKLNKLQL